MSLIRLMPVTGVVLQTGETVPGLRVTPYGLAEFLSPGMLLDDGETIAGWSTLVCDICGEEAHWCPDLREHLPREMVAERQRRDLGEED